MTVASKIDDTTVVLAGMRWQSAEGGMGRVEARSRAKGGGAHAFILRAGDKNLGTAKLSKGLGNNPDAKLVSFAGTLADAQPATAFCGIFPFEDGYAFVAVEERGLVLPDGDRVFDTREAALSRFENERLLFPRVYAPVEWGIAGAGDSAELLSGIDWQTAIPMQTAGGSGTKTPTTAIIAVVGVLTIGGLGWQYWHKRELDRAAEEAAKAPPPPPKPWVMKPKPYDGVLSCIGARGRMADLSRAGWNLKELECDLEGLKFKAGLDAYTMYASVPRLENGATFKLKSDASGIEVEGKLAPARNKNRNSEAGSLISTLAARNIIVSAAGKLAWQSDQAKSQFNFEMAANIEELGKKLGTLPTLSLNRLRYSNGQWRIDGEIFNQGSAHTQ